MHLGGSVKSKQLVTLSGTLPTTLLMEVNPEFCMVYGTDSRAFADNFIITPTTLAKTHGATRTYEIVEYEIPNYKSIQWGYFTTTVSSTSWTEVTIPIATVNTSKCLLFVFPDGNDGMKAYRVLNNSIRFNALDSVILYWMLVELD